MKYLRNSFIALGGLILFILFGSILFEVFQPRPFHWYTSFQRLDKNPFGAYVLGKQLPHLFPKQKVRGLKNDDLKFYSSYDISYSTDTTKQHDAEEPSSDYEEDININDYLFVDSTDTYSEKDKADCPSFNFFSVTQFFESDKETAKLFKRHLECGNNAYISFISCTDAFEKGMGFTYIGFSKDSLTEEKEEALRKISFTNGTSFNLDTLGTFKYFDTIPENAEIIATNGLNQPVIIKANYGNGWAIINLFPYLFSNYGILKIDSKIAEQEILRLPLRDTYYGSGLYFWDFPNNNNTPSLLSYIHSQPALKFAYYLTLFSLLLFLALRLRRLQRPTPVVKPKENLSLNYVRILSDMYRQQNNEKFIVKKKMEFLLHQMQTKHRLNTQNLSEELARQMEVYTQTSKKKILRLFVLYNAILAQEEPNKNMFEEFNSIMQSFKI